MTRSPCCPFAARRKAFARRLGDGVAVLPGPPVAPRNGDVHYDYRQSSDVYYLTGFEEPETVAVLAPNHPKHRFVLFVRPRDKAREVWDGPRAGVEGARRRFGADAAYPIAELDQRLPEYLANVETLYYKVGRDGAFDDRVIGLLNRLRAQARAGTKAPSTLKDPSEILAEMRLFKGPEEIRHLREAIRLTDEGHRAAMAAARPGMMEFQVQAEMERAFKAGGSPRLGYGSIVGSGPNATILHYVMNDRRLKDGDLLLIDAGTEMGYYTADITRTFPVNGRFSPAQRQVYEVVLASQEAAIRKTRPGVSFQAVHDEAVEVLVEGCRRIGLLKGSTKSILKSGAYKEFYMHRTSHWLGMDVHDAGSYRESDGTPRRLKPGMVLTIEPGLYISPDSKKAPARFRGIGVRIEDDILVTASGRENLSAAIPKDVEALESLVGRGL